MKDGFIKVASVAPELRLADCRYNAEKILEAARQAAAQGAKLLITPELSITGYTCADLFSRRPCWTARSRRWNICAGRRQSWSCCWRWACRCGIWESCSTAA